MKLRMLIARVMLRYYCAYASLLRLQLRESKRKGWVEG